MFKEKFIILLICLLLLIVVSPFFERGIWNDVVRDGFTFFIFLSALNAVSEKKKYFYLTLVLLALSVGTRFSTYLIRDSSVLYIVGMIYFSASILFLILTSLIILGHVLKDEKITRDKLAGAICVYLLLGLLWASIYGLMETVHPGSFKMAGEVGGEMTFAKVKELIYYSYVTITTLGYGDITPVTQAARSFSMLEAVIGPLYMAILIARLVALHITHTREEKSSKKKSP
ncbi:MAG: potassium channel family protein [Planctomycetota bacterium]